MKLGSSEFANSFGVAPGEMPTKTVALIQEHNFELTELIGNERDGAISEIIDFIIQDSKTVFSSERPEVWNQGWSENLEQFRLTGGKPESLTPQFIKPNAIVRWNQKYCNPTEPGFELRFIHVLREFIFETYFGEVSAICEFGAGSGHNLYHASNSLPETNLIGTDYAKSAVQLMHEVSTSKGIALSVHQFDITRPLESEFNLPLDTGALTICAIEQVGDNFLDFFDYLIQQRVKICVNIEPTTEFYDTEILEDYLANWFQAKRGYPSKIALTLKNLESQNQIKIHKIKRLNFGSKFSEGYNLFVWSPV